VGLAITLGSALALPAAPVGGILIDRFGAKSVVVACHVIRSVAFSGYLLIHGFAPFLAVLLVMSIANQTFQAANQALVAELVEPSDRDRWYGLTRLALNAGLGAGSLVAAAVTAVSAQGGLRVVVAANSVSFVVAAWAATHVRSRTTRLAERSGTAGGYRTLLRDRAFLGLVLLTPFIGLSLVVLQIAVPPFLVGDLHQSTWIVGLLFALSTAVVLVAQIPVLHALDTWRRTWSMALGIVCYGTSFVLLGLARQITGPTLGPYLCLVITIYTLGEVVLIPTASALAANMAPADFRGRYLSAFQSAIWVGRTAGPVLFTGLLGSARRSCGCCWPDWRRLPR